MGLVGGINLYQYAPNPLSWIAPLWLTRKPTKCDLEAEDENKPFALELNDGLDRFAERHGVETYKCYLNDDWWDVVKSKLNDSNITALFNFDAVDSPWRVVSRAAGGYGATDWELSQIYQGNYSGSIKFFEGGNEVPNPFL